MNECGSFKLNARERLLSREGKRIKTLLWNEPPDRQGVLQLGGSAPAG